MHEKRTVLEKIGIGFAAAGGAFLLYCALSARFKMPLVLIGPLVIALGLSLIYIGERNDEDRKPEADKPLDPETANAKKFKCDICSDEFFEYHLNDVDGRRICPECVLKLKRKVMNQQDGNKTKD